MRRVYPHPMRPQDHPEFTRRWARATTREDLGGVIQFAALRRFTEEKNRIVDIGEKLDLYTQGPLEMGKVVWPYCSTLAMDNFEELVDELKRRGLFLFDVWGYVPGTNPAGQYWGNYRTPYRPFELMRDRLGGRFLGMGNGEQDGRYIGAYAHLMYPTAQDRKLQYLNFYDYFAELGDDMSHFVTALCSLNYGHYFAAMGDHIMLGAETAQALPSNNLWYAYLRGAGKQYGLLWFGNASVWNRFSWKNYTASGGAGNEEHGPEHGTSLSLLRRLMYSHYAYNCSILGYESGWFYSEGLEGDKEKREIARATPIGEVQHGCVEFSREHPDPGALYTPVAFLLDFSNGWTYPRHLYTDSVYKTWGAMPYEAGDHQVHALYDLVYPGYQDAGFFHDERGFLTPTPFGDAFDVLFNDVRPEILRQYSVVILAGRQRIDAEVRDKLEGFVATGGHLVLTAAHLEGLGDLSWLGLLSVGAPHAVRGGRVSYKGREHAEAPFDLVPLELAGGVTVLASVAGKPFILRARHGDGMVDVVASPYGLRAEPTTAPAAISNKADEEIPRTFHLLDSVAAHLSDVLAEQKLVDVGNPRLGYTTSWVDERHLVVTLINSGSAWEAYKLSCGTGTIKAVREWKLPPCPATTLGYYPAVTKDAILAAVAKGSPSRDAVEPGDVRVFALEVEGLGVALQPPIPIAARGDTRFLSLWHVENLRDALLTRERLRQHFGGVKIEAKYLLERDTEYLKEEGAFFRRQKLDGIVDFIGLLNYYPKLTLIENLPERRDESIRVITGILDKMQPLGLTRALFALHRNSENNFGLEQARQSFASSLSLIADLARERGITVYLSTRPLVARARLGKVDLPGVSSAGTAAFIRGLGKPNLKLCLDVSHALMVGEEPAAVMEELGPEVALLAASAPVQDGYGQFYNAHEPMAGTRWEAGLRDLFAALHSRRPELPICLNAVYESWDEVYRDVTVLEGRSH
jgi:sugar phosphate isomerase/epimerase